MALFGFSANPPTGDGGHVGIVKWLLRTPLDELGGRIVDEVWVLPVFVHRYAEKRDMPAYHHRRQMAELAFRNLDRVRVDEAERRVAERGVESPGTIDVLRHLEAEHPACRFVLVLGQDADRDLREGKWKASETLRDEATIVCVRRPGEGDAEAGGYEVPGLAPVSSTAVRQTREPAVLRNAVPSSVADYIVQHGLYGFGKAQAPTQTR